MNAALALMGVIAKAASAQGILIPLTQADVDAMMTLTADGSQETRALVASVLGGVCVCELAYYVSSGWQCQWVCACGQGLAVSG